MKKSNNRWFKCILFTGGAGTGKTRVLVHLTTTSRIVFICPTNVSGSVMSDMFYTNTLFGPKSYKTYLTMYKFFHEDLRDTDHYRNLMSTVSAAARAGNVKSLDDFYSEYGEALKDISAARYEKLANKLDYINPKQYEGFRRQAKKHNWFETGGQFVDENDAVIKFMLASNISATRIPDPLLYDTYVIDESGRLPALEGLQLVHYDKYIHYLYDTCHKMTRRPNLILVGSCTQNKVINQNSQDWGINDYSLITMVTAPFFRNESYLSKLNVFNRRCNRGDLKRMTLLSHVVERLEVGLPMTDQLRQEFLATFSVPFFTPTVQQLKENREEILGRLHIAKRHKVLNTLQDMITPSLTSVEVTEFFTCNHDEDAKKTPFVYRAHEELAACYQSIQYRTDKWECQGKVYQKPVFGDYKNRKRPITTKKKTKKNKRKKSYDEESEEEEEEEEEKDEKLWLYTNKRKLLPNMLYKITHWVNCTLIAVDGELNDFIKDLEAYKRVVANNFTDLLCEIIMYLHGWAPIIEQQDKDLYTTIMNLSSYVSKLDADLAGADSGKHADIIHNLKVEVTSCLKKLATVMGSAPVKLRLTVRKCLLTHGMTCILEEVEHNSVVLRLGRTFRLRLYKKMVVFKNQSVTQFSTRYSRAAERNLNRQKKPLVASIEEGWEEEEDLLFIQKAVANKNKQQPQHQKHQHMGKEIAFYFFPLKLFLIETIDSTQSASFNFCHLVLLTPGMAAEDFIVAVTRTEDASLLNVYFEGISTDQFYLFPLHHTTRETQHAVTDAAVFIHVDDNVGRVIIIT